MPIEIHTLVVKAVYNQAAEDRPRASTNEQDNAQDNKQAIIEACVTQVLDILERKQRR